MDTPVILMHGLSQEEVVAVMRAAKAALGDPGKVAFAMTTETSLEWKLRDVVEHVGEEHAFHRQQKT